MYVSMWFATRIWYCNIILMKQSKAAESRKSTILLCLRIGVSYHFGIVFIYYISIRSLQLRISTRNSFSRAQSRSLFLPIFTSSFSLIFWFQFFFLSLLSITTLWPMAVMGVLWLHFMFCTMFFHLRLSIKQRQQSVCMRFICYFIIVDWRKARGGERERKISRQITDKIIIIWWLLASSPV